MAFFALDLAPVLVDEELLGAVDGDEGGDDVAASGCFLTAPGEAAHRPRLRLPRLVVLHSCIVTFPRIFLLPILCARFTSLHTVHVARWWCVSFEE